MKKQNQKIHISFDGQLFLKGNKTGIPWCAHNLILHLASLPNVACTIHVFTFGCHKSQLKNLLIYQERGCTISKCRWFNDSLYKLVWLFLPIPYRSFWKEQSEITQFFNYVIPPGTKGKAAVFIHDMVLMACPETMRLKSRLWLKLTLKHSCQRAAAIMTGSEFSKREIIRYLKADPDKIHVIPDGVDQKLFHPHYTSVEIEQVKNTYGICGEYLLYVGTIEPRKNLLRMMKAFANLRTDGRISPSLKLILVGGNGWKNTDIYQTASACQSGDSILFTGYLPEAAIPPLMCGAICLLFPSFYEGFGMPVIEAMACGTPVITSKNTAMEEISGDAALLIDPNSTASIEHGIHLLLTDRVLRNSLREKGLQQAARYSWDHAAQKLLKVYQSLNY